MRITDPRKFITFLLLLGVMVTVIGSFAWGGSTIRKTGELVVAEGDGAITVWRKAVAAEFTARTLPWRYYAWRRSAAAAIKAGVYHLEAGEPVDTVIARLVAGDVIPDELSLTFPEGFTLKQMAARTAAKGIGSEKDFISAAVTDQFIKRHTFLGALPIARNLEGYLFPDTYRVFDDDSPRDVIARMLANFDRKFTDDLRQEAHAAGRSLDDIVIMASIIEREVLTDEDMATVSGILWKRFDEGAGLDADATIRYALEKWDGALTVQDLAVDSPYNTRRYRGLPPAPISNPGLRALVAAVRPQESEYYYYLSGTDGKTYFARTHEEHNVNKAKYLR